MRKLIIALLIVLSGVASQAQTRPIYGNSAFNVNGFTIAFVNSSDSLLTVGATYLRVLKNADFRAGFARSGTQTITSGTSTTITAGVSRVIVNPASVLASHTITMPASPVDGQIIDIQFGGSVASGATVVTTLTISPNSGQSLMQPTAPTTAVGGNCFGFQYNLSNTTWYRRY